MNQKHQFSFKIEYSEELIGYAKIGGIIVALLFFLFCGSLIANCGGTPKPPPKIEEQIKKHVTIFQEERKCYREGKLIFDSKNWIGYILDDRGADFYVMKHDEKQDQEIRMDGDIDCDKNRWHHKVEITISEKDWRQMSTCCKSIDKTKCLNPHDPILDVPPNYLK